MKNDAPALLEDHKEKKIPFFEAVNAEKLWWALMHSKGLLNKEVQDLYRKARSGYENIILNDHEVVELQEVEYCLWKLHYKHIDEYRKRIRPTSANATNLRNSIDIHMEGFKSFLTEATEFYKDLIIKIKQCCGLPKETFYKEGDGSVEPSKLHKFQYAHHRFLVCLGDLARYRELCKKPDIQNRKWSVAATYYLEATMVCPDSGNPQNQLALLATYVGDDFLALYHCVRSLAVKEPFPDAWDNLMLLFEKNRSSHLPSLSSEARFDFSKPSERSCSSQESNGSSNNPNSDSNEHVSSGKAVLWRLFVRMISFFFVKSSLEDFPCTFASTMRELESLLALDDTKLKASLESYEHMDSARRGPYRALQVVSTLIFIIHNLSENPEPNDQKEKNDLALNATFIYMGRLLERCNGSDSCRLLGAVLVFIEWLVGILEKVETYGADEKVSSTILYFFGALVDLLNRLDFKDSEVDNNALWEDYELRGFAPISRSHISLEFSTRLESVENYDSKNGSRAHRLFLAAINIVENSQKWISYDKLRKKFYAAESRRIENEREPECGLAEEYENDDPEESQGQGQGQPCAKVESVAVEEEEVILFRPITRYNSAPICADEMRGENSRDQTALSDEYLRRASSLIDAQNRARPNTQFKQPEPLSTYPPSGPPSLSAWVVNRESLNIGKGTRDFTKYELSPIEEIATDSFTSLSISDSLIGSSPISGPTHDPSPYVAPMPSAPLLPDDALWFKGNSPNFPERKSALGIKEADGILGPSPLVGYPHWSADPGPWEHSPGLPGFIDGYPPFSGMSSSEWLYNYQNSHNLERGGNHVWPVHLNPLRNFNDHDASKFDVFDRWGNPLAYNRTVYMDGPQVYPGPNPYGCGAGTELRVEQPPLLQYLKEREWQLQREPQVRGPQYMGN